MAEAGIPELGKLPRVNRYLELLNLVDKDDSLFNLIAEEKTLKFKFSQIERLLVQRRKLQLLDE